jgi:hypothetical protein
VAAGLTPVPKTPTLLLAESFRHYGIRRLMAQARSVVRTVQDPAACIRATANGFLSLLNIAPRAKDSDPLQTIYPVSLRLRAGAIGLRGNKASVEERFIGSSTSMR